MIIKLIVATSTNNVIGYQGKLPWYQPKDMQRFKELTTNHIVLMGRKTYQSLQIKPLPKRLNIILTKNKNFKVPQCITINHINQIKPVIENKICYVIGGEQIFKQMLPYTNYIYQTLIHANVQGDTYFPNINPNLWYKESESYINKDGYNNYPMTFLKWSRIKNVSVPLDLPSEQSLQP